MSENLCRRIAELEEILWRDHRTVVEMPEGVPEELQVRLIEENLARIREEGDDSPYFDDCPICQAMKAERMEWTRHIDFCSGCCPTCEVLEWCRTASEMHSPEEIAWMREHGDYPPPDEGARH